MSGRRTIAILCAFAASGLLFGIIASVANHTPSWAVLSKVIGVGWSWAAIAILAAAIAKRRQTLVAITVLVAAVAGYYASDLAFGSYDTIDYSDPKAAIEPMNAPLVTLWQAALTDFAFWAAGAVLVSWPLARIGAAMHRADAWGLAARIATPAGATIEMLVLKIPVELAVQPNESTVLTYSVIAALGAVSVVLLCAVQIRRARLRHS